MWKKLIILILALSFVFVCPANVFAADIQEKDLKLLTDLGVYDDSFSDLDAEITRARFSVLVSRLIGNGYDYAEDMTFSDVSREMAEYGDIYNLYYRNMIAHAEEFRPNDVIKSTEAIKILVCALGYDYVAQIRGGYPTAYQEMGSELKLYKGVNHEELTVKDALQMILNALDATAFDFYSETTKDLPLTKYYRNITCKQVTITANEMTAIDEFPVGRGEGQRRIKAGGEVFIDNEGNAEGYLGFQVKIWYNPDTMEIVSVIPVRDYTYKRITPTEIVSINDAYTITYEDVSSERTKTVRLDASTVKLILNGTYTPLYDKEDLNIDNGYIEMYDMDKDGDYDIVYVWEPQVYVVNKVSSDCLYFKYGETFNNRTYIKKDEDVDMYLDGKLAQPSDFMEWDIVNIYDIKGSKRVRVESEFHRISGKLTGMDVNSKNITVDGIKYEVNPVGHFDTSAYKGGEYLDVYLDLSNRVYVAVEVNNRELQAGYLTRTSYDDEEKEALIEVFSNDGTFVHLVCAEKTTVYSEESPRGKLFKKPVELNPYLAGLAGDGQIVKYSLDKENKVKEIYFAIPTEKLSDDSTYPLKLEYDVTAYTDDQQVSQTEHDKNGMQRSTYGGVLYFRYRVNWGPRFYLIPSDPDDHNAYQVKYAQEVGVWERKFDSIKLYNCDINGEPEIALTVAQAKMGGSVDLYAPTGVVTDVASEIVDDETVTSLTVLSEGKIKKIIVPFEFAEEWEMAGAINAANGQGTFYDGMKISDIEPGDIIHFSVNYKNEVEQFRVLLRRSDRGDYRLQSLIDESLGKIMNYPSTKTTLAYGNVVKKYPGPRVIIEVKDEYGNTAEHEYVFIWRENYVANYYLIEEKDGRVFVEQGNENDIAAGDEIAFRWTYHGIDDVFIYKTQ